MSVEGIGARVVGTAFELGPSSNYPQQTVGESSGESLLQFSQAQEPNVLDNLLKGFGEGLSRSEADSPFSSSHNEITKDETGGLSVKADAVEGPSQNGNDALVKAFDRALDMAAATLVVSGFSDSMRQLIRQQ